MSSPSMRCVQSTGNADQVETTVPESGVQLNGTTRHATELPVARHANGFRFGPRDFGNATKSVVTPAIVVAGASFAQTGFELTTYDDVFVSWFECPLDAIDAMKVFEGPCKVVRCADRVLMKHRRRG